ncbi:MAG: beta-ketoacyl-[acyl-carrier-protein] synthase family protein [Candidatus Omnitrophica bacterium]|nr:beta-ketoacyl-[acyl-carrier-protein] synthase family protein [Candidatus Omnitrophota bacterium]
MNDDNDERRVVVTGLGVVSSIGIGWPEFWKNLIAGKSGISRVTAFDTSQYDRHYAGEVKNFDPTQFMSAEKASKIGRASQMAIAASKMALEDAGLKKEELPPNSCVCMGTTTGEIGILESINNVVYTQKNIFRNAALTTVYPAGSLSANVAHELQTTGHVVVFSTACAAGNYAVGFVYDLIKSNKCDLAIVGGSDPFSRIVYTGFNRLYTVAPEKCQPFDKNRKGMIPGEGAGVLILESMKSAKSRSANLYAEVLGYGLSCNANHMTDPLVSGIASAIKRALHSSKVDFNEVNYISAHGTGTVENDKIEVLGVRAVFNESVEQVYMSSIKSMLGHTMGAASALESVACSLSIKNNIIPPTINYEEFDEECNIKCVPNASLEAKVDVALNNASAFGGNNACVVFGVG